MKITAPYTSQAPGMEERGKNSGEILWNYPSNPAHGKIDNSWGESHGKNPANQNLRRETTSMASTQTHHFQNWILGIFSWISRQERRHISASITASLKTEKWKQSFCTEMQFFEYEDICYGPSNQCCVPYQWHFGTDSDPAFLSVADKMPTFTFHFNALDPNPHFQDRSLSM